MGLNESIYGLAEEIKASPEFSKLKKARSVISKRPDLSKDLSEFNTSQKKLFSGKFTVEEAESRVKQLNIKFQSLSKIPEVDNYLKAQNEFNKMMSKIYEKVNEHLEKGLQ